jgi:predicted small secreted protein
MTRARRRRALTVAPFLSALALSACGGGGGEGTGTQDKNAYARAVNDAQTEFASTVTTVSQEVGPSSSIRRQQRTLRRFEAAIEGVVEDLRGIDPPSEVEREHDDLVDVMSGFGDDIEQANAAMRDPTPRSLDFAKRRITSATQTVNARVNAAIAAINVKLRED